MALPAYQNQGHFFTACNAAPYAKFKMATRGPTIANLGWKGVYPPKVMGALINLHKFFDFRSDGEKMEKIMTEMVATNVVAN